ncbi:MAG: hypothetical protein QNJ67_06060 [Kiloniellales bacterium]|nr:hypothetical protein [Kiloniellales bacterium]
MAAENPGHRVSAARRHGDYLSDLEAATQELMRALDGLQRLADQPGYEFVDRLMTGYIWSVEQIQELNSGLSFELEERNAQAPCLRS